MAKTPTPITAALLRATDLIWMALIKIYNFCGSIKLAVFVVAGLAATLTYSTFYEAQYGTKAVQETVYRSPWFTFLLASLGINIFCSAMLRYPWKRRHLGFLIAHIGILTVLFGSAVTRRFGLDGQLPLAQNETGSLVTIDDTLLEVWDKDKNQWAFREEIKPAQLVKKPMPITFNGVGLSLDIEQLLPKSVSNTDFIESPKEPGGSGDRKATAKPALLIEIFSTATGIKEQRWFQASHPEFSKATMGLAEVHFIAGGTLKKESSPHGVHSPHSADAPPTQNPNRLDILATPTGELKYAIHSRALGRRSGTFEGDKPVFTGWRDFEVRVVKFIPHAVMDITYSAPQKQTSMDLPPAVKLKLTLTQERAATRSRWFAFGESAEINHAGRNFLVRFGPRIAPLPFSLRLEKFEVGRYPGTNRAMTYQSVVKLIDPVNGVEREQLVAMNEPLVHMGYTFYQASYQETPYGYISVFSVGRDPGRFAKYLGSILLVLGIIFMYIDRYIKARPSTPKREVA